MQRERFALSLVYQERIGDILFLIGTLLAIISTYQAERIIVDIIFDRRPRSERDDSANTIALESWFFFIASIIFARVGVIRWTELIASKAEAAPLLIKGSELSTLGGIIKVIGFGLSAIGNQLKANSSSQMTIISQ